MGVVEIMEVGVLAIAGISVAKNCLFFFSTCASSFLEATRKP
jgi:hypothetical protein